MTSTAGWQPRPRLLSTDTLRQLRSILKRSVARAQARDKVKRNVVLLCDVPTGQDRPTVQGTHPRTRPRPC